MDLNEFQNFLANFEQGQNEVLQESTEIYQNALSENPSAIISLHLQNILSFQSEYLTSLSIILLKRAFITGGSDIFDVLEQETIDQISEILPKLFENEDLPPFLFTLLADTSSYIACQLMKHEKMLNFIPHLVKIVKEMSPTLSPPALNCIVQCNNYSSSNSPLTNFETSVETYELISLEDVYLTIATALTNDFSIDFTIAALRMLFSFYKDNTTTPQLNEFAEAVSEIYSNIPEQELAIALSDLYVFCKQSCGYFSQTLPNLVTSLLSIVEKNNGNGENGLHIQAIAIDIYICLAQYYEIEFKPFLNDVVASVLVASCNYSEDSIQDDIESSSPYSDRAIFYLSELFSKRTNYQSLVTKLSQEMIQSEEWNCRRSALSAIYQLLNSCETGLDTYLDDIYPIIQEHLSDPNHLCRYYSFKSISELCSSYSLYVSQYTQTLIPLVIEVSKAEVDHQTKVVELESLESLCSNVPTESILQFTQSIIEELLPQIEDPNSTLMEQLMIIKCMSKIALSTETNFDQFYSESIGWLKTAIEQIEPGNDDLVRIQSIKTISLVGKTVNLELFLDDGVGFLNHLLGEVFFVSGDNEKSSILYLIQEMSSILPQEVFTQFIPPIFNILEAVLSKELDVEEYPLSYDISFLSDKILIQLRSENKIISYSRPQLSLNQDCIDTVIVLIENLKGLILTNVRPISKLASSFITAAYFPPIQSTTLRLFDSLIILYREFDGSVLSMFLPYVRNNLFSTVSNFFANPVSVLCETFDLLTRSMDGWQFDESITSLLNSFIFEQLPIKRQRSIEKSTNENSSELISLDELEISLEKFAKVLLQQSTQEMIESSPILLHSECTIFSILYSTDLYIAMSGFEMNLVDLDQLMSYIFESLNSSRMNLCYAALISLSKIILLDSFDSDFIQQSIQKINNIIQLNEEDEDNLPHKVIDGALIALASILKITYGKIDLSSIITIWFKQMPVSLDDPDANIAFEVFYTLFNDKNPQVFNPESITHLLECCCEAISLKKISTEIKDQIIALLKDMFSNEEMTALIQEAVSSLTIRDRKYLQNVIY